MSKEAYLFLTRPGAERRWGRRIWAFVLLVLIRLLTRVDMQGVELLPDQGPVILYFNHIHYLDPFIIVGMLRGNRYTVPIAKRELASGPVIGKLVEWFGVIFVERGAADITAVRAGIAVLKAGYVLLMAPEGTRNKVDHALQPAQKGLALLQRHTNAVLQPVGIWGTPAFPGDLRAHHRRPLIHIRYGRPYRITIPEDVHRKQSETIVTEIAMQELAALLPDSMHGAYTPRAEPHPWQTYLEH